MNDMDNQPSSSEQISPAEKKFLSIFTYAPLGLVEIEESGKILRVSLVAQSILDPILAALKLPADNIFPILDFFDPELSRQIKAFKGEGGNILNNFLKTVALPPPNDQSPRHFEFSSTKMFEDCIIVAFEDLTEKYLEEKAMQQADLEKAVAQGKFEIASEVLHDIGNAVVGFGSYLTRIKRSMEQTNTENLQNVVVFIKSQQAAIGNAIGAPKTEALITLLEGIVKTQNDNGEEVHKSITEQLNIIGHIQEILTIQRQYVTNYGSQERKPVNLKAIISDCRSMLFATYDKKGIVVTSTVQDPVPMIKGDRTKLMQVILNILKNSIEAIEMDAQEKNISIHLQSFDKTIQLTIQDTGKGFEAESTEHFFERGYTTKKTGTGLGLYNCRSIIESHAGTITLYSPGNNLGATTIIKFAIDETPTKS